MTPLKVNKHKYTSYTIEDGILCATWTPDIIVTIEIAKKIVHERFLFCNGKKYPALVDITGLASIDTASRKYLASQESLAGITAGALLVDSLISKLAAGIYITVDKPSIPVRLFTDKQKAIKWLKPYVT